MLKIKMKKNVTRLPFSNSFDYIRATTFFDALAPASKMAILEIILDDNFLGATDPQALGFLYALLANNDISSVLQLGTWMGFSTVVLADALKRSIAIRPRQITFDTVENDIPVHNKARQFIARAGLQDLVRCFDGSTLDGQVMESLLPEYDFIYVDSSHSYQETKREIELYYPRLRTEGVIVFHDASKYAAIWDPTNQGGVRHALDEWVVSPGAPKEYLFLEKPLWSSDCGLFIAKKEKEET